MEPVMTLEGKDGNPEEMAQLSEQDVGKLMSLHRGMQEYQLVYGQPFTLLICGYQGADGASYERVASAYQTLMGLGYTGEILIGPESFCRRFFQYEIAINTVFRM